MKKFWLFGGIAAVAVAAAVVAAVMLYTENRARKAERFYQKGRDYLEKWDLEESLRCYRKAAALGSAKALYEVGVFYEHGWRIEKDEELAVKYFEEAEPGLLKLAKKGDAKAQLDLSFCYAKFYALEKYKYWQNKAIANFRADAERGDADAQFMLAQQLYDDDPPQALKWYRKAAERGHLGAMFTVGGFYFKGIVVSQDYSEGLKWFHRAAERGNPSAEVMIAEHYLHHKKDHAEAVKWYRRAAEHGNKLGELLLREQDKASDQTEKNGISASSIGDP